MNTTELIELAKVCEAYTIEDGVVTTVIFGEAELQQFAQRIEQPHKQQIKQLREALQTYLNAREMPSCAQLEDIEIAAPESTYECNKLIHAANNKAFFDREWALRKADELARKVLTGE